VVVRKSGRNKDGFTFRETEPIATMACMMMYGSYENIGPAYQSFAYWLEEHKQYEMTGFNRQICHKGPYNEANPEKYLTEIQIPVKNRVF
jgi:effector-binding domain-containing protein